VTYVSGGKWAIEDYGHNNAAHTSRPALRAHRITIPNRLGKCLPRSAAGSLDIVPWHALDDRRDAGIPLDHRQAKNRHVAAQPDQITIAL